ncbi:MAG: hypothetical protein M0C28_11715 [Candidatus Moduliflexus flocculans]|nr:hypothetical protein [Candidatus Moduliflexus flocculans]
MPETAVERCDPRPLDRRRHAVRHPVAGAGRALASAGRGGAADRRRRRDRPAPPISLGPAGRRGPTGRTPRDRCLLLSFPVVPRDQLPASTSGRRPARRQHRGRRRRDDGPSDPHRHRRRVLRAPREIRRDVSGHAVQPRGRAPRSSCHEPAGLSCGTPPNLGRWSSIRKAPGPAPTA